MGSWNHAALILLSFVRHVSGALEMGSGAQAQARGRNDQVRS